MARKQESGPRRPKMPRLLSGVAMVVAGPLCLIFAAPLLEPMEDTNPLSIVGYVLIFFGIGTASSAFYKKDDFWD